MPFEFGTKFGVASTVELPEGKAKFDPCDFVPVEDQAVPRKVLFHSGGGESPWLTMGIEIVDGVPECTYLEMSRVEHDGAIAASVRDKHLKLLRIETLIHEILSACARQAEPVEGGVQMYGGPATRRQKKVVGKMQRRRTDPNDRETLELVAAIYKANAVAPVQAIVDQTGMSRSTVDRRLKRCEELGLLPPAGKKGRMRK